VICRRTRECPFQTSSHNILLIRPRVISTFRSISKSEIYNVEKVYKTHSTQVRTITTEHVPSLKCIRIILVSSRHSSKTLEVLREECKINSQEELEKMSLPMVFRILTTSQLTYPEIEGCKNSKDSTHAKHVVKMPNNIVGIVQSYIDSSICQYNSCKTSNSEQYQESQSKQHWSSEPKRPSVHCPKPTKNFNSSRYSNNHCCTCKIPTSIYIQTNRIHVVRPNLKTLDSNSPHRVNHSNITKDRFTCEEALNMTNNTKGRLNQHVYFGVTKKPEQMLVLNNITTSCRLEKTCIEVSISLEHSQSCSKNWKTTNQQNTDKNQSPHK